MILSLIKYLSCVALSIKWSVERCTILLARNIFSIYTGSTCIQHCRVIFYTHTKRETSIRYNYYNDFAGGSLWPRINRVLADSSRSDGDRSRLCTRSPDCLRQRVQCYAGRRNRLPSLRTTGGSVCLWRAIIRQCYGSIVHRQSARGRRTTRMWENTFELNLRWLASISTWCTNNLNFQLTINSYPSTK